MKIERQVRTVNREIVFDQQPHQFITFPGPWMSGAPKKSVMNDEQICFRCDCQFYCGNTRVHCCGNFCDTAGIFHLQAIHRAVIIRNFARAKNFIAVRNNCFQWSFRHGGMKTNFSQTAKRNVSKIFQSRDCISRRIFYFAFAEITK